jgi:hypothetical protein
VDADLHNKISVVSPPPGFRFTEHDWKVDEDKRWAAERETNDDTGFWGVEEDELDREGEALPWDQLIKINQPMNCLAQVDSAILRQALGQPRIRP